MTWRTGTKIALNLYENDEHRGLILDGAVAKRIVAALNQADKLDASWLVKDFNVLYRCALDVSDSVVDPDRLTPPLRQLRAQLVRLKPAFTDTEEVREYLRTRWTT